MNKVATDIPPQFLEDQYIPFGEFKENMGAGAPHPYVSHFRFARLAGQLKERSDARPQQFLSEIISFLEDLDRELAGGRMDVASLREHPDFSFLMTLLFPSFFFEAQYGFICTPFKKEEMVFQTEGMLDMMTSKRMEIRVDPQQLYNESMHKILKTGILILNTFYDQQIDLHFSDIMVVRDAETKLEKHYQFNVVLDYVEIKPLRPLRKISPAQIHKLLNHLDDEALWLEYFPPDHFAFEGLVIGYMTDVTHGEVLAALKQVMVDEKDNKEKMEILAFIQRLVRSYLQMPDVHVGSLEVEINPCGEVDSWNLLRRHKDEIVHPSLGKDNPGAYAEVIRREELRIIDDLTLEKTPSPLEEALIRKEFRSLLIAPLFNQEQLVGLIEFGSKQPNRFNQIIVRKLREVIALFETGFNRFLRDTENAVRLTMQQEFTSIHPSVEWKFREVATKYYWRQSGSEAVPGIDPIVFRDVYPIYGQADIVGSSQLRNESIRADMADNLERLLRLMKACRAAVEFHLLDVYLLRGEQILKRMRDNGFVSSDESLIVDWLTREVHPLIRELKERFAAMPHQEIDAYFDYLDPELNIVYNRRKKYEESVSLLNQTISHFLAGEEEKMQQILPHFFEKYETDGVEYNLYVGQSILQQGKFSKFFLKDFRLWQLIMMCGLTRLIHDEASKFPVPLTTAQLIFVYNHALSIRFHMDEKQFDVDGAYNVRYEILKKRIDKARIKGTGERLTVAGRIAIVWLQQKDKLEYLEYLQHLIDKGLIRDEIEDLELEKMQGVEGLKALRVEVVV